MGESGVAFAFGEVLAGGKRGAGARAGAVVGEGVSALGKGVSAAAVVRGWRAASVGGGRAGVGGFGVSVVVRGVVAEAAVAGFFWSSAGPIFALVARSISVAVFVICTPALAASVAVVVIVAAVLVAVSPVLALFLFGRDVCSCGFEE